MECVFSGRKCFAFSDNRKLNLYLPYFAVYNVHSHFCAHYTRGFYARCYTHGMCSLYPWYVIIIPMYIVHPYFSLKNLAKIVHVIHGKIW